MYMNKVKRVTRSLSFRIIGSTILLLWILNCLACIIGYAQFTDSLTRQYNDSAYRTALTAATCVDGDKIEEYLQTGGNTEDYQNRWDNMNLLCQKQNVTLIYVIDVDRSDYGRFQSVFNTVNDSSGYSPWEVGYQRDTTNDEYRKIYQDLYENGVESGVVARTTNLRGRAPHITVLAPIKNSAGETTAILCVERPMEELEAGRNLYLKRVLTVTIILIVISSIMVAVFLRMQIVIPMKKIIEEARRFARENKKAENTKLREISKIREMYDLGDCVETMENDVIQYMENLKEVTAETERIGTELALATDIQANMLPNIFPAFPDIKEFDIFASMHPAKEVGGDFYDFFLIDEDHLGLVMADVSGKGVPAALFMMMSKIMINNYAMMGGSPKEVLERVNNSICKNNVNDMFVTIWFGILEHSTGHVVAANAGHEYPVVRKAGGQFELIKDIHGLAIGVMEDVPYKEYEFVLEKGDTLFIYTDGVPEATNCNDELFGNERMVEALNSSSEIQPEAIVKTVKQKIDEFVGDAPQFDDITMLAIQML